MSDLLSIDKNSTSAKFCTGISENGIRTKNGAVKIKQNENNSNKKIEIFNFDDNKKGSILSKNEPSEINKSENKDKILKTIGYIALGAGLILGGILLYKNFRFINNNPNLKRNIIKDAKGYFPNYSRRIKYTCEHKKAFLQVEKELCGKNSISGYLHDVDKLIMYVVGIPQKLVQKIHLSTAPHHIQNGKVKNPIMAVIDWECAHLTKPDKPLRAREFYEKFCPKIPEIEEALKKLGL